MNHKNKQIYSNREGGNGSHRIDDHLRVSTIKTAHRSIITGQLAASAPLRITRESVNTSAHCQPSQSDETVK